MCITSFSPGHFKGIFLELHCFPSADRSMLKLLLKIVLLLTQNQHFQLHGFDIYNGTNSFKTAQFVSNCT